MADKSYFAHPQALVESEQIGSGTRIWAFAHVMHGASIGVNCNIGDQCYIEGGVIIGDDVVIKNGVSLWEGVTIEDRVFIGPNVSFTNDLWPRAKQYKDAYDRMTIKRGASIGANATLIAPVVIGQYALVGAGAVVSKDVNDFAIVTGNPGRQTGCVCKCSRRLIFDENYKTTCRCGLMFQLSDNLCTEIFR